MATRLEASSVINFILCTTPGTIWKKKQSNNQIHDSVSLLSTMASFSADILKLCAGSGTHYQTNILFDKCWCYIIGFIAYATNNTQLQRFSTKNKYHESYVQKLPSHSCNYRLKHTSTVSTNSEQTFVLNLFSGLTFVASLFYRVRKKLYFNYWGYSKTLNYMSTIFQNPT